MRKWLLAAAGIIALGVSGAQAQNYPARTITMLIPFAAGGPTDTVGRLIAESMTKTLGQQIVIENAAGAGGTRAPGLLVKAAPDGYTILLHHIGMSTAPTLYRKLAYKPLEDFEYIGLVTDAPMSLIARPNFEAKDFKGVLEYIAKTKEKTSYANAGIGDPCLLDSDCPVGGCFYAPSVPRPGFGICNGGAGNCNVNEDCRSSASSITNRDGKLVFCWEGYHCFPQCDTDDDCKRFTNYRCATGGAGAGVKVCRPGG